MFHHVASGFALKFRCFVMRDGGQRRLTTVSDLQPCLESISMTDITNTLRSIAQGDPTAAEELLPLVYDELRRLASAKMAKEPSGQTLQATALVHEAWLRLGGEKQANWENRRHFFGAASEAMRRILIEKARRKQRERHGGRLQRADTEALEISSGVREEQLLAMDEALELLTRADPRKAEIVKLRYFVGLTNQEIANTLSLSLATVERYWAYAKVWLFERMQSSSPERPHNRDEPRQ